MSRAEDLYNRICDGGEEEIERLIDDRQSEELFLDFKRSADDGKGKKLSQNDRNNLAKAISGFGNSAGGVIVWGVDCSLGTDGADVARYKVPIQDVKRFESWLADAVSGCTIPPHSGVQHESIPFEQGDSGFVVTYVPESDRTPHQAVQGKPYYYIRAGSSFTQVPHAVLAGMFGRRPQASLSSSWEVQFLTVEGDGDSVSCAVNVFIQNDGRGIARDLFVGVKAIQTGGPRCKISCLNMDDRNWAVHHVHGIFYTFLGKSHYLLPPGSSVFPLRITLTLKPPLEGGIKIEQTLGCDGSPPEITVIESDSSIVNDQLEMFQNAWTSDMNKGTAARFAKRLLNIDGGS